MHRQHLMARIDFEPRWMASRIAVVIVGIGTIAPSDRDRGGRGKRKRIPRERMTFRPTAWRHGATRAEMGEGKNKSTTCAREWCFNSAADWSNYWWNIAIITSLSLCPSASPVCLRHVLKMITICIYIRRVYMIRMYVGIVGKTAHRRCPSKITL